MNASPDPVLVEDRDFLVFAQVHLVAAPGATLAVGDAFATFDAFRRARGGPVLCRANFGGLLTGLARRCGAVRSADRVVGLALRGGRTAPAHEALRDAAFPQPAGASAQRLRAPLPERVVAPGIGTGVAPHAILKESDDERAATAAAVDCAATEMAIVAGHCAAGQGTTRLAPEAEDSLTRFLGHRLVEAPGFVVSLEAVRQAAAGEGLSMHDVLARAKARGQVTRRNAWGPDFLTDAQLVASDDGGERS